MQGQRTIIRGHAQFKLALHRIDVSTSPPRLTVEGREDDGHYSIVPCHPPTKSAHRQLRGHRGLVYIASKSKQSDDPGVD